MKTLFKYNITISWNALSFIFFLGIINSSFETNSYYLNIEYWRGIISWFYPRYILVKIQKKTRTRTSFISHPMTALYLNLRSVVYLIHRNCILGRRMREAWLPWCLHQGESLPLVDKSQHRGLLLLLIYKNEE